MESFEEWARSTAQKPCILRWADRLIDLGASWDTFCRPSEEVVSDLVAGEIPILAARDITEVASAAVKRRRAPMAIFWDLENVRSQEFHAGSQKQRSTSAHARTQPLTISPVSFYRCPFPPTVADATSRRALSLSWHRMATSCNSEAMRALASVLFHNSLFPFLPYHLGAHVFSAVFSLSL